MPDAGIPVAAAPWAPTRRLLRSLRPSRRHNRSPSHLRNNRRHSHFRNLNPRRQSSRIIRSPNHSHHRTRAQVNRRNATEVEVRVQQRRVIQECQQQTQGCGENSIRRNDRSAVKLDRWCFLFINR
jgi:hypothetical protein